MENSFDSKLDDIFNKIKWNNRFNITIYALLLFAIVTTPFFLGNFFFITRLLKYRCFIPECDSSDISTEYNPEWLRNAVPFHESDPKKCIRFVPIDNGVNNACGSQNFYSNKTIRCDKFVFAEKYTTIVQDFGIYCDENNWKLTLPGAISSIGTLISFTLLGILSDRYGRLTIIVFGFEWGAITGTLKSFSNSYHMFIILEFVEQIFSGGLYTMVIIYACEQVGNKNRSALISMIGAFFSIGEAISSFVAWAFYSWRHYVRVIFFPSFFAVIFLWISPESIRWLVSKKRYRDAEENFKMNLQFKTQDDIRGSIFSTMKSEIADIDNEDMGFKRKNELRKFFSNRSLACQFMICAVSIFSTYAIYFGLNYYVITFHGNFFINFSIICLVEVPANLFSAPYLDCWNRRFMMMALQATTGLCCIFFIIFASSTWLSFFFFVVAKTIITIALILSDVYLNEMFPTTVRGTLVSACTMIGYLGLQLAVQIPILATYWSCLPLILFAMVSFCSFCLIPFLSETLNQPLLEDVRSVIEMQLRNKK